MGQREPQDVGLLKELQDVGQVKSPDKDQEDANGGSVNQGASPRYTWKDIIKYLMEKQGSEHGMW